MRSLRFLWLAAAACLLAITAALLASRGLAATTASRLRLPSVPKRSAPLLRPIASSDTTTTVSRTFVSTSGSDSNACTATAPCRSFATALTRTTAGGEVVALTSGGYGPVGIGMAVTLVGAAGVHASITNSSGDAIDVEAGSTDTVVLRNLYLNGLGGGTDGIDYTGGAALKLENITATGFTSVGVEDQDSTGQLTATDLDVHNNDFGFAADPASGTATVDLDGVRAEDNNADGIAGFQHSQLRVSDCIASGNGYGVVADVPTMVSGCQLSDNVLAGFGVGVDATATAQIAGSTVTHNLVGLYNHSGTLQSFGDNLVAANTSNTSGTITTIGKS